MRILVTDGMDKSAIAALQAQGHEVVEQFYAPEELGAALRDFDVVIVRSKTKVRANHIDEAKGSNLKLIIRGGVGVDNIDVKYAEENGIKVIVSQSTDIEGVYTAIRMISALVGKVDAGEQVIADMQNTFTAISELCEKSEKTIYFEVMPLEWGLWTAGSQTFMHELAHVCGMENAFADLIDWQPISQEQVIERDPDYIVLVTGMGETAADEVLSRDGWEDMKAVQNKLVFNADSYAMTRPGPRLAQSAIDLYEFLYNTEYMQAAE